MPPTAPRVTDLPLTVEQSRRRPNLRAVPAGYDLDALPIHLPPHPGEAVLSWMRRLAVRYDVPVRDLLRGAGTRRRISSSRTIATRLRNQPGLVARLGLTAEQTKPFIKVQPLTAATTNYSATFGHSLPSQPQFRYCPYCLAEADPWWPDHWHSPLSWICPTHHIYLLNACPACGQPPHGQFAWIGHVIELHRCPSRRPTTPRAGHQRSHEWCNADLTTAPTTTAAPAGVAGQQLLHDWANDPPTAPVTVAGLDVTHRIAFQALVELIDAGTPGVDLLDLADDPAEMGPALADAAHVLSAADLSSAADRATMLTYDGPHAPVRPTSRLTNHRYSPLLAAIQLAGIRDHLPTADQMMFRTVHHAPRYPATHLHDPQQIRQLRLPEHNPRLPEPTPAWIPQTIWPLCVPEPLLGCTNHALRDSLLAMALVKIGNHEQWMKICQHLRLPATHPNRIGTYLRYAQARGTWPAIHTALDSLITRLQHHPPPIDYQQRRMTGRNINLLTEAVQVGRRQHPTDTGLRTLTRQFWERFTAGDIAYGPEALRLDPDTPSYADYRRLNPLRHADLFHSAHQYLLAIHMAEGPLIWTPEQSR
ncbi:TniQ family protein [Micropruina glycogenica]|uniref:TniQ family protein n=1 Tax=Micropruina glycogenica TaxID=75385 RepID=UPI000CF68A99|nr:TniQ family protein [Micropruina glycogenica]